MAHYDYKFEIRNNMAYASQMQFEVLRRALWAQQAKPQTAFDWKFRERAARDPKMTACLNRGVKAKMCETTPLSMLWEHSMLLPELTMLTLSRPATLFEVRDITTCIGLSNGIVHPMEELSESTVKSLLKDVNNTWSTMVMRTRPFSEDLFQSIHPNHQVLVSCKPHPPGCHEWKPVQTDIAADIKELQPDVIVECYLAAKYYHYDPADIYELVDFNVNAENLVESDDIVTVQNIKTDEYSAATSLNDNFQEPERACPENGIRRLKQYVQMARTSSIRTPHQRSRLSCLYGRSRKQSQSPPSKR